MEKIIKQIAKSNGYELKEMNQLNEIFGAYRDSESKWWVIVHLDSGISLDLPFMVRPKSLKTAKHFADYMTGYIGKNLTQNKIGAIDKTTKYPFYEVKRDFIESYKLVLKDYTEAHPDSFIGSHRIRIW